MKRLGALLLAAALLFAVRIHALSLPSLEDAFYAREAVEMLRAGRAYTVTWDGEPTHQHPPLQLWLVSRAMAALGETDLAARLPTVLMALGTLAVTYRIGVLTVGPAGAVAGVALLLVTPLFIENARRLMMEVPLAFWIATTILLFLEGRRRPGWHVALGLPLGAALLTKSVLGLMPLLVIAGSAVVSRELRAPLRRPWIWLGLGLGLGLGASWPVHQYLTQGPEALRSHFAAHVLRRSARRFDAVKALVAYPWILLKFYQPLVLPGLVGAWRLVRRPDPARAGGALLAAWIVLPVLLYSLSTFRTPRFVFPILVPLALCAGHWLAELFPRATAWASGRLVPFGVAAVAVVLWVGPAWLLRDQNAAIKASAATLRALLPEGRPVPYLGRHYWLAANPLLYYAERRLAPSSASAEEAVAAARRGAGLLLCARRRLPEVLALGVAPATVLEGPDWTLLRVGGRSGAPGG